MFTAFEDYNKNKPKIIEGLSKTHSFLVSW